MFLGVLLYAIFTGFSEIGWLALLILGVIAGLTLLLDYLAQILGAKKWGASGFGILGAILGLIIGIFVGGIIGLIVMPILGTIIFELLANKKIKEAFKSGVGVFVGFIMGVMVKLVVAVAILGWFLKVVVF